MPHPVKNLSGWFSAALKQNWSLGLGICALGLTAPVGQAAPPTTAPAELNTVLSQIDAAANRKNVSEVMQFYGANFSNSDGLTRETLGSTLSQFWGRYPQLTYRTELKSWQPDGKGIRAETITYINGTQTQDGRTFTLKSVLRSQQHLEGKKIVRQDMLGERTEITSGSNPPTLTLNLPEQVAPGATYALDAIVKEPLGDRLLLGAVTEEPVKSGAYWSTGNTDLDLLSAGGLFKTGRAPNTPGQRWISAIVVRDDGLTQVTQRLRVEKKR